VGAIIVSSLNQKGGVGKTTTIFNLGGQLTKEGYRVLLCDVDPQASLSQGFFGPEVVRSLPKESCVAALFDDAGVVPVEALIRPTNVTNLSLIPSARHLNPYNIPEPRFAGFTQVALRDALNDVRSSFDWVLIDCPPNLGLCSWSALTASDFLLVPFQPEDFGCQGIFEIDQTFQAVRASTNGHLQLAGYLLTMVKRRAMHRAYEELLRKSYGNKVFTVTIPDAAVFTEAIPKGLPLSHFKPNTVAGRSIRDLAAELQSRIATLNDQNREVA